MQGESQSSVESSYARVRYSVFAALSAALTAVGALIKIPFFPVPMTLQTLFTLTAGVMLPPRWAAISQVLYLLVGLAGLPVFADGGGAAYVLRPTFGYLLFLPLLAYGAAVVSARSRNVLFLWFSFCILQTAHLLIGTLWMSAVLRGTTALPWSPLRLLTMGTLIFLPSAAAKAFVAAMLSNRRVHFRAI